MLRNNNQEQLMHANLLGTSCKLLHANDVDNNIGVYSPQSSITSNEVSAIGLSTKDASKSLFVWVVFILQPTLADLSSIK
ncbi:MAG: hypothetical protein ACI8RD_010152 [Bacillariaceae sp.]|jgi:hypothetical protein